MNIELEPGNKLPDVEKRVENQDTSLFAAIHSETSQDDRSSLLAIQASVACRRNPYRYLEIGSHLGGSIQPHLLDPRCAGIVSIDKRPEFQPDERDSLYAHEYRGNSTARMMANLKLLSPDQAGKVTTIDGDTGEIDLSALPFHPDLCFIDGEHADNSVLRDFEFCVRAIEEPALIVFHDAEIVFRGLKRAIEVLKASGRRWHAYHLPTSIFVVELGGEWCIHKDEPILRLLIDNHVGYLANLESMVCFRDFYNRSEIVMVRKLASRFQPQIRFVKRALRRFRG
jgi:hypothetical protein